MDVIILNKNILSCEHFPKTIHYTIDAGLGVYSAYGDGFGNKQAPKLDKVKLEEYRESDTRKLRQEIELLKAKKKELENRKLHEIALYEENFTDGGSFRLAITALDGGISKIDVEIKQKTLELKK